MPSTNKPDDTLVKQRQKADLAGAVEQLPEGRHGGLDRKIKRTKQGIRSDACIENDPDERGLEGTEKGPVEKDEEGD